MYNTMFDVDKFIELIKDKPCLGDKKTADYSNKSCRDKAWLEIGEAFFDDWRELDLKTKDERGKEIKKKWKNIKDNFSKFVNEGKSGAPAPKKKKYVYANALTFLLNSIDKRETSGNVQEEAEVPEDDDDLIQLDSPQTQPQPSFPKSCYQKKTQKLTPFQSELLKKIDDEKLKQNDQDPDKLFLFSILPDFKKLNEDDKFEFKINLLQFIREAKRKTLMTKQSDTPNCHPFRSFSHTQTSSQLVTPQPNRIDPHNYTSTSPHEASSSSVFSEYQSEYQFM